MDPLTADMGLVATELTAECCNTIATRLHTYGYDLDALSLPIVSRVALNILRYIIDGAEHETPGVKARMKPLVLEEIERIFK
jgi:hypothetical protein